jgi:hypothetical protein
MVYPFGDSRRSEYVKGTWRGVMMADQGGDAHDVIHVGMGDENGINCFHDTFGQMGYLAAIEEQSSLHGADSQKEERIIQQTPEKSRFYVAEGQALFRMCHIRSPCFM